MALDKQGLNPLDVNSMLSRKVMMQGSVFIRFKLFEKFRPEKKIG